MDEGLSQYSKNFVEVLQQSTRKGFSGIFDSYDSQVISLADRVY